MRSRSGTDILHTVTTQQPHPQTLARRVARPAIVGSAMAFVAASTVLAGPAVADVPEGWSNPEDVDMLHALLLLAGLPLLIFVVITLAVYVPAMVRGEKLTPGPAEPSTTWFGGPRQGSRELAEPDDETSAAGGARGRW
jgi:hypothetical protein